VVLGDPDAPEAETLDVPGELLRFDERPPAIRTLPDTSKFEH
jgi:hypothetical protein